MGWMSVPITDIVKALLEHLLDLGPFCPAIRPEAVSESVICGPGPGGNLDVSYSSFKGRKELPACFRVIDLELAITIEMIESGSAELD